jgi:transcriptional regulator with XRE-family HTH domain
VAELDDVVRERLAAVFARQDFYEACKRRDAGAMVCILGAHGITQGQMCARTGLAQSTLSNYKRGKNQAEWTSTFEKLANGLDMPLPLRQALGLTGDASPGASRPAAGTVAGVQADTFDLQLLAEAVGRNGTDVKRRDMLALAAQLGATAALAQSGVWERLAYALTNPDAMNEATIKEMEARSAGFHHLEEIVSAPVLLKGLTVHLREVSTLLNSSAGDAGNELRRRLIVVAGESSVLAGWLASDIGDSANARNFYDTASRRRKRPTIPRSQHALWLTAAISPAPRAPTAARGFSLPKRWKTSPKPDPLRQSRGSRRGMRRRARNSATTLRHWHHGHEPKRHSASATRTRTAPGHGSLTRTGSTPTASLPIRRSAGSMRRKKSPLPFSGA